MTEKITDTRELKGFLRMAFGCYDIERLSSPAKESLVEVMSMASEASGDEVFLMLQQSFEALMASVSDIDKMSQSEMERLATNVSRTLANQGLVCMGLAKRAPGTKRPDAFAGAMILGYLIGKGVPVTDSITDPITSSGKMIDSLFAFLEENARRLPDYGQQEELDFEFDSPKTTSEGDCNGKEEAVEEEAKTHEDLSNA